MENTKVKTPVTKDILAAIKAIAEDNVLEVEINDVVVTSEILINYANKMSEQIDRKNEKSKERNAAKKAAGDALKEQVLAVLTEEPQTRNEITAHFEDPAITVAKVGARLTQLVADGKVVKTEVKPEGSKSKVMAYALA